jgi:hypothetical protein
VVVSVVVAVVVVVAVEGRQRSRKLMLQSKGLKPCSPPSATKSLCTTCSAMQGRGSVFRQTQEGARVAPSVLLALVVLVVVQEGEAMLRVCRRLNLPVK